MKRFVQNDKGQGIMEYVIISSLVGICCLVAMKQFGDIVKGRVEEMKDQIKTQIANK